MKKTSFIILLLLCLFSLRTFIGLRNVLADNEPVTSSGSQVINDENYSNSGEVDNNSENEESNDDVS